MSYSPINKVTVTLQFDNNKAPIAVGILALKEHKMYFEYDSSFLKTKLNISPLKLPLKSGLITFSNEPL